MLSLTTNNMALRQANINGTPGYYFDEGDYNFTNPRSSILINGEPYSLQGYRTNEQDAWLGGGYLVKSHPGSHTADSLREYKDISYYGAGPQTQASSSPSGPNLTGYQGQLYQGGYTGPAGGTPTASPIGAVSTSSQPQTTQTSPLSAQTQALQNTATSPAAGSTSSADQYLQAYLKTLEPSAQELQLQGQLGDINARLAGVNASRDLGIQGVNEQPIATPFLTGQATAITNRAAVQAGALGAQAMPLKEQLALAQARRQGAIDVNRTVLEYQQDREKTAAAQRQQEFENQLAQQQFAEEQRRNALALQLQQQGMSQDEAYRQANLQLDRERLAQQQSQFLSGQNQPVELNPGNTYYNPQSGSSYTAPTTAQQNQTQPTPQQAQQVNQGRMPVTLGNGQTVYIDQQGNHFDAYGKPVSHQTTAGATAGSGATVTSDDEYKYALQNGATRRGTKIGNAAGSDGYVDPNVYVQLYDAYVQENGAGSGAAFTKKYPPKQYINPQNTWIGPQLQQRGITWTAPKSSSPTSSGRRS